MTRGYHDPCGIARALDLVGERWALLIVRELMLGPKRFADLRRGLPGASQSVLSQRLDELERAGVLHRRQLGPPTSAWVYELRDRGRELEPVLLALATWGSRAPLTSGAPLSVDALAMALKTTFDATAAAGLTLRCELRLDGDRLRLEVRDGRLDLRRGSAERPDAVIETTADRFRALVFTGAPLAEDVVHGDRAAAERLLTLFPRPTPA